MPLRSIETKEQRQQRFLERDLERKRKEQGLSSLPGQAAWMAGLMLPTSGGTDYFGMYPEMPTGKGITGETLPSFAENIQNKEYLDAFYQGLGITGDLAMGAGAFYPPLLGVGAGMKVASGVGKAAKASKQGKLLPKYKIVKNALRDEDIVSNPDVLNLDLPKEYETTIQAKYAKTADGKFIIAPDKMESGFSDFVKDPLDFTVERAESFGKNTAGKPEFDSLEEARTALIDYVLSEEITGPYMTYSDPSYAGKGFFGGGFAKKIDLDAPANEPWVNNMPKVYEWLRKQRGAAVKPSEKGIKAKKVEESVEESVYTDVGHLLPEGYENVSLKTGRAETEEFLAKSPEEQRRIAEDNPKIQAEVAKYEEGKRAIHRRQLKQKHEEAKEVLQAHTEAVEKAPFNSETRRRALFDQKKAVEDLYKIEDEAQKAGFERFLVEEATADELLDWQKPLTEQQPAVQEKIKNLIGEDFFNQAVGDGYTGEEFYDRFNDAISREAIELLGVHGSKYRPTLSRQGGVSAYLEDAGIKGIAYGPRSAKIFNPKKTDLPKTAKLPKSLQTPKKPAALTDKRISAHTMLKDAIKQKYGGFDPSEKFQEELWSAFPEPYVQKKYDKYGNFTMSESVPRWARSKQSKYGEYTGWRDLNDLTEYFSETGSLLEPHYTKDQYGSLTGDYAEVTQDLLLKDELIPEQAEELATWNMTVKRQEEIIETLESGGYTPEGMTEEEVDIALKKIFADQETVEVEVFDFSGEEDLPPFNSGGPVTKPLYADRRYL